MGTNGLSPGVKRPERDTDHSPPSSTEVNEWMEVYFYSPYTPSWRATCSYKPMYYVKTSNGTPAALHPLVQTRHYEATTVGKLGFCPPLGEGKRGGGETYHDWPVLPNIVRSLHNKPRHLTPYLKLDGIRHLNTRQMKNTTVTHQQTQRVHQQTTRSTRNQLDHTSWGKKHAAQEVNNFQQERRNKQETANQLTTFN